MSEQKKLNQSDPKVIDDAVRLLKKDFVALYEGLGYNKMLAGVAWHTIRGSKAGQAALAKYKELGAPSTTPLTVISDMKEEIAERKEQEETDSQPKTEKKVKKFVKSGDKKKGGKAQKIKELIAAGERNPEALSEKSGASVLYVKWLMKQEGLSTKKERKSKKQEDQSELKESDVILEEGEGND